MIEIPLDVDLDMLAYDIADTLDRGEYGMGDITQDEIRKALPVFLRACLELAAAPEGATPDFALGDSVQVYGSRLTDSPSVHIDAGDSHGDDYFAAELAEVSEVENVAVAAIVAAAWLEREQHRGWHPIAEAPVDGTPIMARVRESDAPRVLHWDDGSMGWQGSDGACWSAVEWRPLILGVER